MKIFKIILLIILGLLDFYFLYSTIGYTIQIFECPRLIGETTAIFGGYHIMTAISLILFILTTIIYVIVLKKLLKMEK